MCSALLMLAARHALLTDLVRAEIPTCRAARFEFPCRTAHPSVEPCCHGGTSKRGRADLISNPRRHRGRAYMSDPEGQLSSSRQASFRRGARPTDVPRISQRRRPTPSIHLAVEFRGTHAQIVHACTLEPPDRGTARGNSPMKCRSHVMSPHWNVQSQVRSGSAARTVWFTTAGMGQPTTRTNKGL